MPITRKSQALIAVAILVVAGVALPWVAGQLVGWKVQRQLTLLDQHPALSVLESGWQSGYGLSEGYAVIAERVGCGVRTCSEVRVEFSAKHLSWAPLGWGTVVASADLNGLLHYELNPPVQPLNIMAQVGLLGDSHLTVQMSPSWHELHAERADAIAFSGIYANFDASDYAERWEGDLIASFTVITESATSEQRQRIGEVMQSLGTNSASSREPVGSLIVRVVALMKELSTAIMVWQGKERAWKPEINSMARANVDEILRKGLPKKNNVKPLKLELTPDMVVSNRSLKPKVALQLPSFEAWHGDVPIPAVVQKLGPETYEQEPELEVWQLNLQFTSSKVTLNGLALWRDE